MKKTRKAVSLLLSLLIIFPTLSGTGVTAFAEETDITDYLTYEHKSTQMYGDGINITGCDTSISGDIVIPDTIDGYPVVYLGDYAFKNCDKITSVTIPDSVKSIHNSAFPYTCKNLKEITIGAGVSILPSIYAPVERVFISEKNKYFSSDEYGIVYNKDKTAIVLYPSANPQVTYTIPSTVTSIRSDASAFSKKLAFIDVADGNTAYSSDDYGVLYNTDKTRLIRCPQSFIYTDYEIPDGVMSAAQRPFINCTNITKITIGKDMTCVIDYLFAGCDNLAEVELHDNIQSIGNNAFASCPNLSSVSIPAGVTSIGNSAFAGCSSLTEINLHENINSIGESAFSGCSKLTTVRLPDGITEIKDYAFRYCKSLTEIIMSENIKSIGAYSFYGCSALESVELPEGITEIPDYAFYNCTALEEVTLPDSVETIGMATFQGCSIKELELPENLTAFGSYYTFADNDFTGVVIPDGVSEIPNYCFRGCDKLVDVIIPEGVTVIAESAFRNCTSMKEIVIPASVETIGTQAFSGCDSLNDISFLNPDCVFYDSQYTIPSDAVIHGYHDSTSEEYAMKYGRTFMAFGENNYEVFENLTYEVIDGAVTIIACDKESSGEITIPEEIGEYPVALIGEGAFDGCVNVTSVIINDTDVVIFDSETTIPASITIKGHTGSTAESYAVKYSRSFVSVDETDIVKHLKYIVSDGEVIIRGYNPTISGHIVLPDKIEGYPVTRIAGSAFFDCETITGVVIPESVTVIMDYAFKNCKNLETAVLPDKLTELKKGVFYGCQALKSIEFPETLTAIGDQAFRACVNIDRIEIPGSVKSIGELAFDSCQKLSSIILNEGLQEIGAYAFMNCYELSGIAIPDSVTVIGKSAFISCRALANVTIGKGLSELESDAFRWCKIESFSVDSENGYFSSDKYGVFFNKDKTLLIQYPAKNSRINYIVPDTVAEFASEAFYFAGNLKNVTLPDGIKTISNRLFYYSGIEGIIIPEGVETIGQEAFALCYYLRNVQLPESLTSIEKNAFHSCNKISEIKILNSDCEIYDDENTFYSKTIISAYAGSTAEAYAIKYNRQFEEIPRTGVTENLAYAIENGSVIITGFDKIPVGSIFIPDEIEGLPVTGINPELFAGNVSVLTVVLPDTVTEIKADSFRGCTSLKKVVATGVSSIGNNAFALCRALDTVVIFSDSVSIADNAFDEGADFTVFVKTDAELTAPEGLNVITFSLDKGILSFRGEYKSDLYYLFDLVAVMCAYYKGVDFLFFDSFEVVSADDGHIYYYTEDMQRLEFDGTKMKNIRFSVEAFDGENFNQLTFNELCEKVAAEDLSNFNFVIEEADDLATGSIEISLVDQINMTIQRILKALTNLINKLFAFFRKLGR